MFYVVYTFSDENNASNHYSLASTFCFAAPNGILLRHHQSNE